jgi:3-hydroxybutyryl-CoA dehydratase
VKDARDLRAGDTFRLVRTVDRYRPIYYAAASGDFNPIHVDPAVGRGAGLGGTVLHGMCTFAWLADACVAYLGDPVRLARLRARFTRPVRPGDTLAFEGRCAAVEGGVARLEVEARNQRGEPVLSGASAEGRLAPPAAPPAPVPTPAGARVYGPYRFTVGLEHVRDFVAATGMGVPGRLFGHPPAAPHPWTWDEAAAAASPWGGIVAPPAFAAAFAVEPFAAACTDPAHGFELALLVHGEQELELLGPIRPGDVLATTGAVAEIRRRRGLQIVDVVTESVNGRGEPVVRARWTAVIRTGGAAAWMLALRRRLGLLPR